MKTKFYGPLLLILGTCIGAGMLALPIVTARQHLVVSLLQLVAAWLLMTFGAFALLEVNLSRRQTTHLVSMAQQTLGVPGQFIMWCLSLLLMYALICAYVAATSGVVDGLLAFIYKKPAKWVDIVIAIGVLGGIVAGGIRRVNVVNRVLMTAKLLSLLLVCAAITPFMNLHFLTLGSSQPELNAFYVMMTSFGYAAILPSLRFYFPDDHQSFRKVVFIGSVLPLLIYLIWIVSIQALIPRQDQWGLIPMMTADQSVSQLMQAVHSVVPFKFINALMQFFISISALTSFLCVSLSLSDFLADGLSLPKQGWYGSLIYALTFIPPALIVYFIPSVFIMALHYGGVFCVILLIFMPVLMGYRTLFHKEYKYYKTPDQFWQKRPLFWLMGLIGVVLIVLGF